jgi:Protein of unknown function (DUF1441)
MASIVQYTKGMGVSISALAAEFGMDRKTISKRLGEAGIDPIGQVRSYDVYRLRDAVKALFRMPVERGCPSDGEDAGEASDPQRMLPTDRKAWFQSENERLKYERAKRHLIPDAEHEEGIADVIKTCVQVMDTLPDRLERECRLPPAAVAIVVKAIDGVRDDLYSGLAGDDADTDSDETDDDGELRVDERDPSTSR